MFKGFCDFSIQFLFFIASFHCIPKKKNLFENSNISQFLNISQFRQIYQVNCFILYFHKQVFSAVLPVAIKFQLEFYKFYQHYFNYHRKQVVLLKFVCDNSVYIKLCKKQNCKLFPFTKICSYFQFALFKTWSLTKHIFQVQRVLYYLFWQVRTYYYYAKINKINISQNIQQTLVNPNRDKLNPWQSEQ
eukprot:TRINITY_DN10827_c0_g1_i1.p1 TRINITY_DN10827_c0_g1~~TRINITY_DN10827_c0_g1_i1.p1  ORF type:complete len:189 (-),score=-13.87 TRINITY_DN10827_c0_g1_i1:221-787(-)